ncbi:T9SS type A sorting domain-containing protein [uncultured Tenacibaculum sp.]|uniref:T9SS type A sorting domain-containing protein n=1 Tax=uncultured Tenacibaculum sp. TaxID=174713 RepID=UPI00261ACF60|nr:T9SS type A sorting domain-containing protein [uncultured Tenacibaculum sp.]
MVRKLLFFVTLISSVTFAQTFSTGTQVLSGNLSINLETDATTTTLILTGPSNAWFAVGFDESATNMLSNSDVFRTDGTTITDARTVGNQLPPADTSQDWNLVSNTVSGGVRTITATRANNTGDANDFVFSNSAGSIDIIWAFGASTTYAYHGSSNRGATTLGVTLGKEDFETLAFEAFPNPVSNNMNIELPFDVDSAKIDVYDFSGRIIKTGEVSQSEKEIDFSGIGTGFYTLVIRSENKLGIKKILKK